MIQSIVLSVAFQSLILSYCIYFSYGSWSELQQSLTVVGCICLFIWICLLMLTSSNKAASPPPTQLNNSKPAASNKHPTRSTTVASPSKTVSRIPSPTKSVHDKRVTPASTNALPSSSSSCEKHEERVCKRRDYLDWDEYFLSVAMLSAMRSKDPSTQVGACIVNANKRIVGIGYNGFPKTLANNDDALPWNRQSSLGENHTKYPYVCHAEMNAILNKNNASCEDCTIYVILFPCNECAKMIIQSGIKKVVYICDKYATTDKVIASKKLFKLAGIEWTQYVPQKKSILISFPNAD